MAEPNFHKLQAKTPQGPRKVSFDYENSTVVVEFSDEILRFESTSAIAFEFMSNAWLRAGWDVKHVYSFSWLGRPIIQLPEDMIRIQELIYSVKPDVIVETGIAHGGSAIFYASLCKAIGNGRVIAIDIDIREHNRLAIEKHELAPLITLIEGDSTSHETLETVKGFLKDAETVFVLLDSCHTKEHVLRELQLYAPYVTYGSYLIAMDGIMERLEGAPRTSSDWHWNNPVSAVAEFVANNANFELVEPEFVFNEGLVRERVTYSPAGIMRRIR